MMDLENEQIDYHPHEQEIILAQPTNDVSPFPDACFCDDEVNWSPSHQEVTGTTDMSRYTTYSGTCNEHYIYKQAEIYSTEPLSEPIATHIGNRIGVSIAQTSPMVVTNYQGRQVMGVVSYAHATSFRTLAMDDDIADNATLARLDRSTLIGDSALRALMRDYDHRWSHIVLETASDGTQYYYIIDHGRSFKDARNEWNESKLIDLGIRECFWEINFTLEEIMVYVKRILKIPDWEISATCMKYSLAMQKYNIANKQWYLRRAYEMSKFLIRSKRTLEHDVINCFGR